MNTLNVGKGVWIHPMSKVSYF